MRAGSSAADARRWSIVIPVKDASRGKSRLDAASVDHTALARAIALDTIEAVARATCVAEIVVVTDDPGIRSALAPTSAHARLHNAVNSGADRPDRAHPHRMPDGLTALWSDGADAGGPGAAAARSDRADAARADAGQVDSAGQAGAAASAYTSVHNAVNSGADRPDRAHPHGMPDGLTALWSDGADAGRADAGLAAVVVADDPGHGLNAAIAAGLRAARGAPAALLGDVPALRPTDLDEALLLAGEAPGAVADAEGTGTTLLVNATPGILRFGAGSFRAHIAAGAHPLDIPAASTLRRDVDTAAQLAAARTLGLGRRTSALLA